MKADTHPGLDGVVLVRLLVRPKSFTIAALGKDLQSLMGLDQAQARSDAEATLARLKERGFIWADTKLMLTEEGEAVALKELGYSGRPKHGAFGWRQAKKALVVRQLEKAPGVVRANAGKSAQVAAWLIAQKYGLQFPKMKGQPGQPTPNAVLGALARRLLGLSDTGALDQSSILGALLGFLPPATAPVASDTTTTPRVADDPEPNGPAPVSPAQRDRTDGIADFARVVEDVALAAKEGRWLGHKVFIVQVWRDFVKRHPKSTVPLDQFKRRLVEAVHAAQLTLSRADLIGVLPQDEVRLSETEDGRRTYHFVETEHLVLGRKQV